MTKFQINTDKLDVVGDMASEVGRATMTMAPPGGKSETAEIKYLVVWKRLNGTWLLHRDIYNAIA
jgi:ketosteroid isomerase-like protein